MSEFDELRRLGAADPVEPGSIPSADEPAQRALMERIMMSDRGTSWTRKRAAVFIGAAAAVVLAVSGIVLATRGPSPVSPEANPPILAPGGMTLCIEQYSLETLPHRETAFDGTVKSVSGDEVTFTVNEWFKGGSGDEVTLKGASGFGGITSAGSTVALDPGTRLLVSGDAGFAWSCGDFTQPYSADLAAQWRTTLS